MNKRTAVLLILFCLVLLTLVLFLLFLFSRSGAKQMTLELSGTTGLRVEGAYTADGATHEFSGVLPTNVVVRAEHFKYLIRKSAADGELEGRLWLEREIVGSSKASRRFTGIEGEFSFESSLFHSKRSLRFSGVPTEE